MTFRTFAAALAASTVLAGAAFADTVKVGVIGAFTGPFAFYGEGWQQAFDIWLDQHGGTVAGHEVEFVYRDLPAADPQQARALAQELVIRERVQYLAGFVFTPDVMAAAPVIDEAQIPTVVLNAGSSAILDTSEFMLRASFTTYQMAAPVAQFALDEGETTAMTLVADYAPGVEEETAFTETFEAGGGDVVQSIRMPLATTDFGPYLQQVRAANPDVMFVFLPGGPATFAFLRNYADVDFGSTGIRFLGTGETQEFALPSIGDAALGLETGFLYSADHDSELNRTFAADLAAKYPDAILALPHTEGYDFMQMLEVMVEATDGQPDGPAAIEALKGLDLEGLRGPLHIDAENRDLLMNVYMRRVERDEETGELVNREFRTYEMVPDTGRGAAPAQ